MVKHKQSVKRWSSGGTDTTECRILSRGRLRSGSWGSQAMSSDLLIKGKLQLILLFAHHTKEDRVPE